MQRQYIYKGNNLSAPYKTITTVNTYQWSGHVKYATVRTKIQGEDKVLIIVAERDMNLRAYDPNSNTPNTPVWTTTTPYFATVEESATISFADLNMDGIPEVMIYNKVYDSTNGSLLCQTSTVIGGGLGVSSVPIVADVYRDGTPRFFQGNMIYKPNAALTTLTLEKTITASVHASDPNRPASVPTIPNGGRMSLVDMDLDGQVDMVISVVTGNYTFIYIADPVTGTIKASKIIEGGVLSSYPFVGDIDGDGYPEIVFITRSPLKMYAYKYIPGEPVLEVFWSYDHTDSSGGTAMTLFDFNQDGISEIVYRDEQNIRIINGSLIDHEDGTPRTGPYNLASIPCTSGTATEYPVVADIDGDGQAEIVIGGGTTTTATVGYLWVFKSGDPVSSPWAPARKVWNQYAYNSLNVNENLTVPKIYLSPATVFPGEDGILGTADDVRPFNNFLQQQTMLNKNGTPLWLAPNGQITGTPVFNLDEGSDNMNIKVQVTNVGDAPFKAPFKVTVYKNEVGNTKKFTHTYPNAIAIGETAEISFTIPDFQAEWTPNSGIIVKINDSGNGTEDWPVCQTDYTEYNYRGIIPTQQIVCVGAVGTMTCNFILPAGPNTYQWQMSLNNWEWMDILGETSDTYTPASEDQRRGIRYYRVVVSDGVVTENSVPARVRYQSCKLPVNHNIGVMGY
ncbi:MAG: VCBS repeat-containing protein [Prevotella sp.]|jgi:hypothetical protein|nr:VCBS repeat-containing protein [Prevotella sp.]